ncbi:MAG: efflux RND transporter periplasmic adaptor subunit [Alphaproteobacteria bacterium]|nr:efflux RND transporter periplasmic adaptor subunit [Alphaproteobacteria bacterium]
MTLYCMLTLKKQWYQRVLFMTMNNPSPLLKRYPLTIPVILLIALGIILFLGIKSFWQKDSNAHMTPPPPMVSVLTVETKDTPISFEYAGRISGKKAVEVRARVSGTLLKRNFVEGTHVKRGTVLFIIDPAPYEAALAQAKARFTQTERDWIRAKTLMSEKALSLKEYDATEAAYEQAKADLKTAKINLEYTTVKAPLSGVTSKEAISEGNLVVADTTLLTYLTEMDALHVNFAIPDVESIEQRRLLDKGILLMPLDKKLQAEIILGDGTKHPTLGAIDFTDSIIDGQTGSIQSRALLANADQSLLPGMFVRVRVKGMSRKNALLIPDRAVMQGPQGTFVYGVGPDSNATIKPVKLGMLLDGYRLVEEGLTQGDKVIIEGMIKVRPNTPVQVEPDTPPSSKEGAPSKPEPSDGKKG